MRTAILFLTLALTALVCSAQKRLVLIDQDASGPGGSDQMAIMSLLEAPQVKVLGITIVTGDSWRAPSRSSSRGARTTASARGS